MSFLSLAGKAVHDFWPMVPCSQLDNLSRLLDFQPIKVIAARQPAGQFSKLWVADDKLEII
jgi:hypothetical protein